MTNSITKQHTLPTSPAADWLEYNTTESSRSKDLLYVCGHIDKETHAEIIRASNSHDDLLNALKLAEKMLNDLGYECVKFKAAIAKAEDGAA